MRNYFILIIKKIPSNFFLVVYIYIFTYDMNKVISVLGVEQVLCFEIIIPL